jgi:exonuclease SbcC
MHLTSLSLRNYRVYRELDLEFPDGLIGIYGPNGGGKSSLVESITFCLYGISRTSKDELRSAGVGEDLRATLVFEHEGNAYEVRRVLKGVNLTPAVQVFRNGQLVVSSVRDANAWLAREIGMTASAFTVSVCAQQKELTAFATMQGAERRKLVLDLLGVSPVERALTKARESARTAKSEASGARQALVPLDGLEQAARDAQAELESAQAELERAATAEKQAAEALETRREAVVAAERAVAELTELDAQAKLARAEAAQHREAAAGHERRAAEADRLLPALQAAEALAAQLPARAATLKASETARDAHQERATLARAATEAAERLAGAERARADADQAAAGAPALAKALADAEAAVTAIEARLEEARGRYADAGAERKAAEARLAAATEAAQKAAGLDPAAPCPTCGQELGASFESVSRHRLDELQAADAAYEQATRALEAIGAEGTKGRAERERLVAARDTAAKAQRQAEAATVRAESAAQAQAAAAAELATRQAALEAVPDPGWDARAHAAAVAAVEEARAAETEAARHRAAAGMADEERARAKEVMARADEADGRAAGLEARTAALPGRTAELSAARAAEQAASAVSAAAHGAGQRAEEALTGARRRLTDRTTALEQGRAAHERVAALDEEAHYLARVTDLVKGFRMHLVSRLGSRLGAEAARLFADLTDNEYADLEVDSEDYSVRIVDNGTAHELNRFSGSENDLASLSLRVAISLVIAESAGELGLLVLDEVLGALDRDRRERMLAALTSLQGRFRQVLLVTHNEEVKDMLPMAIEVRKGPGRTSTAALVG